MLMKEIRGDLNEWRDKSFMNWNIVQMSLLLKLIHRFNAVPVKSPAKFLKT